MIRMPSQGWEQFLVEKLGELLKKGPVAFSKMKPSELPDAGGVYLITKSAENRDEVPLYVGRTKHIRQRLYNNHLMGPLTNARLKKYLIDEGSCKSPSEAKTFIKAHCSARWVEEGDSRTRGAIEGFVTARLFPEYGIEEEH